ncbi:MAG: HAD family phosphatase [Clostridia bacterium]|nr:HAD family phosphatase [Clostridia bacterium]
MIKAVVFDFGQVLVHFVPKYMVERYVPAGEDATLLEEVVFDRTYWDRLDAGTITNEQTLAECHKRLPERLWAVADKIYYNWIYNIPEIDGMREVVMWLKGRVPLYLLSNISNYFAEHAHEVPILSLLDGCVFSAPIGIVKPSREIFAHLCDKFNLVPEETLFVDDNAGNIKGAGEFGIKAYHFDGDASKLLEYLKSVIK